MALKTIDRLYYKALGEELNKKRVMVGKSYREISIDTGISATMIDNYFLGKAKIKDDTFKLICNSLGIDGNIELTIKVF